MSEPAVSIAVNGSERVLDVAPGRRLLDVLREDLGLTGTKEGCGEGECGSCSVLLDGRLVCSCLVPIGQCDGSRVTTVEGLAAGGELDAVQAAFVAHGAVQCGACTPGMVLTAHALLAADAQPTRARIREAVAGTLCRCTGYEGIVRAVLDVAARRGRGSRSSAHSGSDAHPPKTDGRGGGEASFLRPRSLREALDHLAAEEELQVVAGCTDLLVKHARDGFRGRVLDLTRLEELRGVYVVGDELVLGALTSFAELRRDANVQRHAPMVVAAAATIGAFQIQNRATLGGNLVNASPAADAAPPLLALGATVELVGPQGVRRVPLEAFFVAYRETARHPREILTRVSIPLPAPRVQRFRKVGTRAAQAISKVVLALAVADDPRCVRIGAGSLAPVPTRLRGVEVLLDRAREGDVGVDREPLDALTVALAADVQPIDDVRSTADYRLHVTARILTRWLRELDRS